MDLERPPRLAPRERTFAQVFPWRSVRKALMLLVLIIGIVVIKLRMGAFLQHAGRLWSPLTETPAASRLPPAPSGAVPPTTVHLGPTLAPQPAPPSAH
jgi:hypothetical protein